jgi:hypothetical protein
MRHTQRRMALFVWRDMVLVLQMRLGEIRVMVLAVVNHPLMALAQKPQNKTQRHLIWKHQRQQIQRLANKVTQTLIQLHRALLGQIWLR